MADNLHEYDLGDMVGSGSSAQVYWAHRVSDGQLVAIKVLDKMQHALIRRQSKSMSMTTDIHEIKLQQQLSHRNVLKILDVFEDARNAFLVLEPCLGGSLQTLLAKDDGNRRLPLDEDRAQHYIRSLVAGIAHIHDHNIIHRDLKLSNILLTSDDVVKIADFGLATDLAANQTPTTICGTPNFIAPEVLLGHPYTISADLWSLGCIAYSLLVGTAPFQGQTVAETLQNVSSREFEVAMPAFLSPLAVDFLQCLLCGEPSKRTPCSVLAHHPWLMRSPSMPSDVGAAQPSAVSISLPERPPSILPTHESDERSESTAVPNRPVKVKKCTTRSSSRQPRMKPRRRRQPRIIIDSSSSESSSNESKSSSLSSGDDADLAQLQTVLDKMALRASSAKTECVPAPEPASTATSVQESAALNPPVASFTVEYHSILGQSTLSEFICSRTSFGLELLGHDGRGEPHIEYHLADGIIRGTLSPTRRFDYNLSSLPLVDLSADVSTWIRLAQWCLGQLPVREARLALPDEVLQNLKRLEELEQSLRQEATTSMQTPAVSHEAAAVAELAGIGIAESLEDGTLCLYFVDGAVLQVDDCAATVSYLPVGASTFDVFPLHVASSLDSASENETSYVQSPVIQMPHEVSRRLKHRNATKARITTAIHDTMVDASATPLGYDLVDVNVNETAKLLPNPKSAGGSGGDMSSPPSRLLAELMASVRQTLVSLPTVADAATPESSKPVQPPSPTDLQFPDFGCSTDAFASPVSSHATTTDPWMLPSKPIDGETLAHTPALSFEATHSMGAITNESCIAPVNATTPAASDALAPCPPHEVTRAVTKPLAVDNVSKDQPLTQAVPEEAPAMLASPSPLLPPLIHAMLDDVQVDIARFYIPVDLVTIRILVHVQRSLIGFLDAIANDGGNQTILAQLPLRRMRHLSCVMGVETILSWLWRHGSVCVQAWLRGAILNVRGARQRPAAPLMITATNMAPVVLAVQKHTKAKHPQRPLESVRSRDPLGPACTLVLHDEIGYSQYMDGLYSPRHRNTKATTQARVETMACEPPTLLSELSPRRGLHVLMSEHIYRHEYRPIDKHIPRFSSKSSVGDVAAAATRRKRGVEYGNLKGKVVHSQ
ncbi:PLK protein kinase [Aphanomyces invadans]|uniref:PLK protein kinase n=1 Tax=Aphanomyces invadans TaxID=157072 RepID=A0A024UT55_9STRA|nr:PLK protein kinase [Aphanomyces invadans]ETW09140.1 PLK protein kinase [Aphanomyces invadans]|eukprot:XP_008862945.1 PLK protein kinase [Aphanomyces invadans]